MVYYPKAMLFFVFYLWEQKVLCQLYWYFTGLHFNSHLKAIQWENTSTCAARLLSWWVNIIFQWPHNLKRDRTEAVWNERKKTTYCHSSRSTHLFGNNLGINISFPQFTNFLYLYHSSISLHSYFVPFLFLFPFFLILLLLLSSLSHPLPPSEWSGLNKNFPIVKTA